MDRRREKKKKTQDYYSNSPAEEEHFIRNGAVLLEKQLSLFRGKDLGCEPCKIFSAKEIKRATNNYDQRLLIGPQFAEFHRGKVNVRGDIYDLRHLRGMAVYRGDVDGRPVAVKTIVGNFATEHSLIGILSVRWLVDFSLNQDYELEEVKVAIKQVLNHKHVVALYGCCLETQVPILVLEFALNGSLHDHLHNNLSYISWLARVRILSEVSHVLAYMHHGTWKSIVHLDVKSSNVFLDENFTSKLSNFGFSVPISPGDDFSQVSSAMGTLGYTDPEYYETLKVTEKCDVYSFGILMVELLTGDNPSKLTDDANTRLRDKLRLAMAENRVLEIVDGKVLGEAKVEEIEQFSKIAVWCLGKGVDRPTMSEVAMELRQIYHQFS